MHHVAVGKGGRRAIEEVLEMITSIETGALQVQHAVVHVVASVMMVEVNRRGRRGEG